MRRLYYQQDQDDIDLKVMLFILAVLVGVFWGAHTVREPAMHAENIAELFALYAAGQIKPRISARFPLERAHEALVMMQDRKVLGKVVVTTD